MAIPGVEFFSLRTLKGKFGQGESEFFYQQVPPVFFPVDQAGDLDRIAGTPAIPFDCQVAIRFFRFIFKAGIFNTEFWVDPEAGIGGILLMQYLPFYDGAAIEALRGFERRVYDANP